MTEIKRNPTPVTVITGASNGIGRAIAEAVLAQGHAVVNLDYVLPTWSHPQLTSYQGDLTDEASTRERAAEIAAQHNAVDDVAVDPCQRESFTDNGCGDDFTRICQYRSGKAGHDLGSGCRCVRGERINVSADRERIRRGIGDRGYGDDSG